MFRDIACNINAPLYCSSKTVVRNAEDIWNNCMKRVFKSVFCALSWYHIKKYVGVSRYTDTIFQYGS